MVLSAKCQNSDCPKRCFNLPVAGIDKYQRATKRLVSEAISGIIQDNSTCPRISARLNRTFNTTGSTATIDRWKHEAADKLSFKEMGEVTQTAANAKWAGYGWYVRLFLMKKGSDPFSSQIQSKFHLTGEIGKGLRPQ